MKQQDDEGEELMWLDEEGDEEGEAMTQAHAQEQSSGSTEETAKLREELAGLRKELAIKTVE